MSIEPETVLLGVNGMLLRCIRYADVPNLIFRPTTPSLMHFPSTRWWEALHLEAMHVPALQVEAPIATPGAWQLRRQRVAISSCFSLREKANQAYISPRWLMGSSTAPNMHPPQLSMSRLVSRHCHSRAVLTAHRQYEYGQSAHLKRRRAISNEAG